MTIQDLIETIQEEKVNRDLLHELTPDNSLLLKEKCGGTFEAVLTGRGKEKCLIPQVGTLHFLYRGQNKEYVPCVPSLYRGNPSEADIFIERMRLVMFKHLLDTHPVVNHFFKKHHFLVDVEGLAQHYGLKTAVLDLTSNLDIALFFATCWYDSEADVYHYYDDCEMHEGIMYVFLPYFDNEPCPSVLEKNYLNHNIRPIGLQAFPRPGTQEGFGLHIPKGGSVKCYMYRFTFTSSDSKYYYDKFKKGESLWIKDILIHKAKEIANTHEFSFSIFNETFKMYRPKGYSASKLKAELCGKITLKTKTPDVLFTDEETKSIIEDWNMNTGAVMTSKIYRKSWFEYDEVEEDGVADYPKEIKGKRNEQPYRTLERLSMQQLLLLVKYSDRLKGAEWKNYTNLPIPKVKINKQNGKWFKVPASMEDAFGKPYLTEEDWKITAGK